MGIEKLLEWRCIPELIDVLQEFPLRYGATRKEIVVERINKFTYATLVGVSRRETMSFTKNNVHQRQGLNRKR